MKFTYLLINFFSVIAPFVFSFHRKIRFDNQFKPFFKANVIVSIFFLAWDAVFTHLGVWGFNRDYITGISLYNLPIEEILFFTCIPFACVFTYYCLNLFYSVSWKEKIERIVILFISVVFLAIGLIYIKRLYTSITFLSAAVLFLVIKFVFRKPWLSSLLSIYPLLLIPFFIVNGILTGSGLKQPVVWYNNAENIGIRLFTIPVEDIAYGLELILANIFFFEIFKKDYRVPLRGR